jgi:glutamine cyclotransferase
MKFLWLIIILSLCGFMSVLAGISQTGVPVFTYKVINRYPHDPSAFTQGLVYHNGFLYEGTGRYGRSALRQVILETGEVVQEHKLSNSYFGEGITIFQDQIFQLTWLSQLGFVYRLSDFQQQKTFDYPTQGWGITHDGTRLIMSDGTSNLYFLDPETLERTGQITVHSNGMTVTNLNELEYLTNEIYANVWRTDRIARISPQSGEVTGWIDLTGLHTPDEQDPPADVLNGIAYDSENDRLFVTGKLWSKIYEIELLPKEQSQNQDWRLHHY